VSIGCQEPSGVAVGDADIDIEAVARELVDGLQRRPWGQTSASVYETGRLVTLSPWLTGHAERVAYLLKTQRPDGGWGAPDNGYALVPTLSATEALLSELTRATPEPCQGAHDQHARTRVTVQTAQSTHAAATAVDRALRFLIERLLPSLTARDSLPDMPAIELIAPALIERINEHLAGPLSTPPGTTPSAPPGTPPSTPSGATPSVPPSASLVATPSTAPPVLARWAGTRLTPPAGMDGARLPLVRELLKSGAEPPQKLLHALEIAGEAAVGLPQIRHEPTGTIGASPAATAAWLGDRCPAEPSNPARWYLETVTSLHDGPVPCGFPLTVFERGWVLAWLTRAGVPLSVPPALVLSLTAPLGPNGTPAAAGLPSDADTTAGALYALALLDVPHPPDSLWAYETESHFCTWQGEDGYSTTTNAHVLEAFGQFLAKMPVQRVQGTRAKRYSKTVAKITIWLRDRQCTDGSWTDRWHASPYYATACCAIALARFGGAAAAPSVEAARRWILANQRADGSWGRWQGTAEETAYAVQTLLLTESEPSRASLAAAERGKAKLLALLSSPADGSANPDTEDEPALWHDKDLYHPGAIVRAAALSALLLIRKAVNASER
jgi:halimadienyl-diphosphate synthase